jgi:hypothetical protein
LRASLEAEINTGLLISGLPLFFAAFFLISRRSGRSGRLAGTLVDLNLLSLSFSRNRNSSNSSSSSSDNDFFLNIPFAFSNAFLKIVFARFGLFFSFL